MNEQNDFERLVADQLSNAAVGTPPESAIQDTIARAGGSRRLPEWLALIKEPPMRTNSQIAVGSPTVRVMTVLAATMLLILAMAAIGVGAQRLLADGRIVVAEDGSGTHTTLAAAIADAADGDEILIRPGTYAESIVTDKSVHLKGDGPPGEIVITHVEERPTFDIGFDSGVEEDGLGDFMQSQEELSQLPALQAGRQAGYALVLVGTSAKVSDLTFRGEDARLFVHGGNPIVEGVTFDGIGRTSFNQALIITGGAKPEVRENSFTGGGGIDIHAASSPLVERNSFEGEPFVGGFLGDATQIIDNRFFGPGGWGIDMQNDSAALVRGNVIEDKAVGMNLYGDVLAVGNEIRNSTEAGIVALRGTPTVRGNLLVDNKVAVAWKRGDGVIETNEVAGGTEGILIESGSPEVRDNVIDGVEKRGIVVETMSTPVLAGNRVCGNGEDLAVSNLARPEIDDTNEICAPSPTE